MTRLADIVLDLYAAFLIERSPLFRWVLLRIIRARHPEIIASLEGDL
jgi:hypothetical protein